ncbi:MAG: ferrous iron transport protein A [Cyanobacteria bacterium]|jgi:hypothetical protein|nr:ferrous iron transport protein A [Cyanobacteria bacterium GSL.Bin21]
MAFNFFSQSQAHHDHHETNDHQQQKPWRFTYLGGQFRETVPSPPANSFSLVEVTPGNWVQIAALPRHFNFPIAGVAVGTYLLVLGTTKRGAVRVRVIGQQVTLASAIAQKIYVRPFYFTH